MCEKWIEVNYIDQGRPSRFIVKVSDIEFVKNGLSGVSTAIKTPNGDSYISLDEYLRLRELLVAPEDFAPEVPDRRFPSQSPYTKGE